MLPVLLLKVSSSFFTFFFLIFFFNSFANATERALLTEEKISEKY